MNTINDIIKRIQKKSILIIGDAMLDCNVYGVTARMSAEAPIPIFNETSREYHLGGAANVAANLIAMGHKAAVCSVIGADESASLIKSELAALGANISMLVYDTNRKTTLKKRYYTGEHIQLFRADIEDTNEISKELEDSLLRLISESIHKFDGILFSDYLKGVLTPTLVKKIIAIAKEHNIITLADPKSSDFSKYCGCDYLKPNKKEFSMMTKCEDLTTESIIEYGRKIAKENSNKWIVVTLGQGGMIGVPKEDGEKPFYTPAIKASATDVCGAGDTVAAYLTGALVSGVGAEAAILLANEAGGRKVQKKGTVPVGLYELISYNSKIIRGEDLADLRKKYTDRKIVFTNGCFDLLHNGHISTLKKAKEFGDILVVGINSDDSVRALKGESRPIISLPQRISLLEAIMCVDFIVAFSELTPIKLIESLLPDVLVKGADYKNKEIVGADVVVKNGGSVELVQYEENISTTSLIKRINEK